MSVKSSTLLGTVAAAAVLFAVPAAAEEQTIEAFAVWQAEASIVRTGEQSGSFAGLLEGTVYVNTEHGPVAAGLMSCPATVEISLDTGRQRGSARCSYLAGDDSRVFADLTCEGMHLVGCAGTFDITGGTGRFAGVTGGGQIIVRGDFREISVVSATAVQEKVTGIMYWPALTYTLPDSR